MGAACAHEPLLLCALVEAAHHVEGLADDRLVVAHAPAAAEDATVALDEFGKGIPRRFLPLIVADASCIGSIAGVADSCVGLRLDRVEVAYGVAVVLPLLLEDRVQAGEDGLLVFGGVGILARRGQFV
jgi:hypothetical protein